MLPLLRVVVNCSGQVDQWSWSGLLCADLSVQRVPLEGDQGVDDHSMGRAVCPERLVIAFVSAAEDQPGFLKHLKTGAADRPPFPYSKRHGRHRDTATGSARGTDSHRPSHRLARVPATSPSDDAAATP